MFPVNTFKHVKYWSVTFLFIVAFSLLYVFVHKSTDADECDENPDICGMNSQCNNTIGSYHCKCMSGFIRYDGKTEFTASDGDCQGKGVMRGCVCFLLTPVWNIFTCYHQMTTNAPTTQTAASAVLVAFVLTWLGAIIAPAILDTSTLTAVKNPAQVRSIYYLMRIAPCRVRESTHQIVRGGQMCLGVCFKHPNHFCSFLKGASAKHMHNRCWWHGCFFWHVTHNLLFWATGTKNK